MNIDRIGARCVPPWTVVRLVHASAESVWDILIDTETWKEWGPSVRSVHCSRRRIELGSEGSVQTVLGFRVPFVITEFVPGSYWAWEVASIRATGHRVQPLASGRCRLILEIPFWAAPYSLVCQMAAERIARMASVSPH
jgi:hypothetical protein